jgi:hypothetical protein
MINFIKSILISRTKLIVVITSILLITGGAFSVKMLYNDYKRVKLDAASYKNNMIAYEEIISKKDSANRVLQLNRDDLKHSNDQMIISMESMRKSLKRPANKPGDLSTGISTSIRDTDTIRIDNKVDFKLDTIVKFNDLTKVGIKIEKDSLISTIDINNTEFLYVYSTREYVNQYKNGWNRFWHFDWKKEDINRYDIKNTNDLIKVGEVRVIKVRE